MRFRSRAVGLLAGSALALSLTAGVLAQTGTTVELQDGDCVATLTGANVDFGTYSWNGTAYVSDGNEGNTTLTATVTDGTRAAGGCDVTFSAGHMSNGSDVISVQYIVGAGAAMNPRTVRDVPAGQLTASIVITSTLNNAFDPGTYTGTVTVDASAAS